MIILANHEFLLFFTRQVKELFALFNSIFLTNMVLFTLSKAYQFECFINVLFGKVMVNHVEETNGFTCVKYFLSNLFGICFEIREINDRNRFNGHNKYCFIDEKEERKEKECLKMLNIYVGHLHQAW